MEENVGGNCKLLYKTLRNLRRKKKNPLKNVKSKNERTISDNNEILIRWRGYYITWNY